MRELQVFDERLVTLKRKGIASCEDEARSGSETQVCAVLLLRGKYHRPSRRGRMMLLALEDMELRTVC